MTINSKFVKIILSQIGANNFKYNTQSHVYVLESSCFDVEKYGMEGIN